MAKVQPRTVVLLSNGSPIEMPWLGKVKGVIEGYLGGQAFGGAAADILFGIANPSGKLAETFPLRVQDNPSFLNFPGNGKSVEYREGLFVGYRYYDAVEREPLFPFGYGLSYTDFSYESITADREEMTDEEELTLTVTIRNRGDRPGKEIVQLYIGAPDAPVQRPVRELKGFEKIYLEPGEAGSVTFRLDKRAFAFYDTDLKDWNAAGGAYDIGVGPSSRDLPLKRKFTLKPAVPVKKRYTRNSTISEIYESDEGKAYFNFLVEEKKIKGGMNMEEISVFFHDMPLRSFHMIAGEMASEKRIHELLADLNR